MNNFHKKIYTPRTLFHDIGYLSRNLPGMLNLRRDPGINRQFVEKIMTVTTAVNGCVYCAWFHAGQAVRSGISQTEVKNLLNLQFHADASDFELPALLYAQHVAETDRHPDPDMTRNLYEYYGDQTADNIRLIIRMITFGNLYGNTWDAVISRRAVRRDHSSLLFELLFFTFNAPIALPAMLAVKAKKLIKSLRPQPQIE
ncbi:MAG: carboxymuconolactone decarboxylase family protein [candidate division KSB1 bacterium]|nr:carboxymuconolactone decarboxylase family protein [candidate division KSB1 bacterium]